MEMMHLSEGALVELLLAKVSAEGRFGWGKQTYPLRIGP